MASILTEFELLANARVKATQNQMELNLDHSKSNPLLAYIATMQTCVDIHAFKRGEQKGKGRGRSVIMKGIYK